MNQDQLTRDASAFMLGFTAWREGDNQILLARIGIMYSILDRVARPCWWGRSVLEVVGKRLQYSSLTTPRDPNLIRWPQPTDAIWWETYRTAYDVMDGLVQNPVPGADSYHDTSIPIPSWAAGARFVDQIGHIRFYDVDRDYQTPRAETVDAG